MTLQYTKEGKAVKRLFVFKCDWCGFGFEQEVETNKGNVESSNPNSRGRKGTVSDQVKCRRCKNFIKTYGG